MELVLLYIFIWNVLISVFLVIVHVEAWSARNMADIVSRDLDEVEAFLNLK